jgi:hypothetical protein
MQKAGLNLAVTRSLYERNRYKVGYPPVVIGPEQRQDYIGGLEAFQLRKNPEPYQKFMTTRLEASLDHYISFLSQGLKPLKSDFRGP